MLLNATLGCFSAYAFVADGDDNDDVDDDSDENVSAAIMIDNEVGDRSQKKTGAVFGW